MDGFEAELARAPDEAGARRCLTEAKAAGRRDEAVRFLADLYRRTRHPGLWAAIRDGFTAPELEGLGPPEEKTVGPEKEPLLERRPYGDVVFSSLRAPFATPGSVFMLVVSGPLMLGAWLALKLMGCLGLVLAAFLYGYLFGFLFDVLLQSAEGRARGPRVVGLIWHEGSRLEFVGHFLRWLGAAFATFWPVLAVAVGLGRSLTPAGMTALGVLGFLLTAWHPIALLQSAFGNGFSPLNYPAAFDRLRRLGGDYGKCAAFFLATTLAGVAIQWGAAAWAGDVEGRPLVARLLVSWSSYAFWLMQMRAAGLLCWARTPLGTP